MAAAANVQLKFPAAGSSDDAQLTYVGHPLRARRVERIKPPSAAALASLTGVYYSPEIDSCYTIDIDRRTGQLALEGGRIGSLPLEVLNGELAAAQGSYNAAIAHLDRAVCLQDALSYSEPEDWHQPVRGEGFHSAERPRQ